MADPAPEAAATPNLWRTLGYEQTWQEPGAARIGWTATEEYCFPTRGGPVVQGGMVTALLDAAMARACWSVLDPDQVFLTADLRAEFLRSARPGRLVATGTVVRRTRPVVFCAAELHDGSGRLLAAGRCTQVIMQGDGTAGRPDWIAPGHDTDTGGNS